RGGLVEVLDREHRLEDALDALAILVPLALARPQIEVVGGFLNLDEVRHLENFADIAIIAPDALLADMGLRHEMTSLSSRRAVRRGPPARRPKKGPPVPFVARVPPRTSRTGEHALKEGPRLGPSIRTGSAGDGMCRPLPVLSSP